MPRSLGQFELEVILEQHGFGSLLEMLIRICEDRARLIHGAEQAGEWERRARFLRTYQTTA